MRTPLHIELDVPEPRNGLARLWNRLGFLTPAQNKVHCAAVDARIEEARLRRRAENGGLDPQDPNDHMEIAIRDYHQKEREKRRALAIRELTRKILADQIPSHSRHELHSPSDVQLALQQATRIYDLTASSSVKVNES